MHTLVKGRPGYIKRGWLWLIMLNGSQGTLMNHRWARDEDIATLKQLLRWRYCHTESTLNVGVHVILAPIIFSISKSPCPARQNSFCETYAVDKWVFSVIYYSRLVLYTLVWGMMHSCEQAVDEEVPNLILINFACQCKHASGKWIIITSLIARAVSGQIAYRLAKMGRLLAFMNKLP